MVGLLLEQIILTISLSLKLDLSQKKLSGNLHLSNGKKENITNSLFGIHLIKNSYRCNAMTYMMFKEPKVLKHLRKQGYVYTVRHYPAKPPYIREAVDAKKNDVGFKVTIETIALYRDGGIPFDANLMLYASSSGFNSFEEWKEAIERQHTHNENLWILKATKLEVKTEVDFLTKRYCKVIYGKVTVKVKDLKIIDCEGRLSNMRACMRAYVKSKIKECLIGKTLARKLQV